MRRALLVVVAGWSLAGVGAQAQPGGTGGQPYAGLHGRPVKALSAEQVAALRLGRGMAMALPAELNRYPGPMHALEHADQLALTREQREALERQIQAMRAAAVALGEQLIALEAELDAVFATGRADAAAIDRLTAAIGGVQGQLRAVHLRTHLETRATLSDAQVAEYVRLRGYDSGAPVSGHGSHRRH